MKQRDSLNIYYEQLYYLLAYTIPHCSGQLVDFLAFQKFV